MRRIIFGLSISALACSLGHADTGGHPAIYDDFIAGQAAKHGVPERLIHRIVQRESRYNPRVMHNHCFGLMQIKYGTARSMGFKGAPAALLDPRVNMTYAIPYLANAYRVAEGDEDRAVALFAGGYYFTARQKHLLAVLRTADSPPMTPEAPTPPPAPPREPPNGLFAFLQGASAEPAPPISAAPPAAEQPAPQAGAAQDGVEPAMQNEAMAQESAEPAPHARAARNRRTATAKMAGAKGAHRPADKTVLALAAVEPPAPTAEGANASVKPKAKAKVAKVHAKAIAVASVKSDSAAPADVQPTASTSESVK